MWVKVGGCLSDAIPSQAGVGEHQEVKRPSLGFRKARRDRRGIELWASKAVSAAMYVVPRQKQVEFLCRTMVRPTLRLLSGEGAGRFDSSASGGRCCLTLGVDAAARRAVSTGPFSPFIAPSAQILGGNTGQRPDSYAWRAPVIAAAPQRRVCRHMSPAR